MAKYIDKSDLVAEIERRLGELSKLEKASYEIGLYDAYKIVLSFIDALKVKEVDFENSVKGRIDYPLIGVDFPNIYPNYKELKDYCDKNGIKDEDKVKIIIIKENVIL